MEFSEQLDGRDEVELPGCRYRVREKSSRKNGRKYTPYGVPQTRLVPEYLANQASQT